MRSESLFQSVETFVRSSYAWTAFFFFSFIVFSPFFIGGAHIVATTDSIFNHFPNLIFGHQELRNGSFGLWNPYIFCGTDFTESMHHHMLNPVFWILFLVPESAIFHCITFIQFVEISLIGLIAFSIFKHLFQNPITAFASAVVAQLSGFTWFTATTFIGVECFFLSCWMIYLTLTYSKRRPIVHFLYITALSFFLFVIGHVGYISAFFFPVIAVQLIYHRNTLWQAKDNPTLLFASALLFALGLSLYRIYPVVVGTLGSSLQNFNVWISPSATSYFLLTGLIPSAFGVYLGTSASFFSTLGISGMHTQFHNLLYYGLPTFFLLLSALSSRFSRQLTLTAWVTLIVLMGSLFAFQPASDLVQYLFSPFNHSIVFRVGLSYLVIAVAAFALNGLKDQETILTPKQFPLLLFLAGMTLCSLLTFYLHLNQALPSPSQRSIFMFGKALLWIFASLTFYGCTRISYSRIDIGRIFHFFLALSLLLAIVLLFKKGTPPFFKSITLYHLGALLWSLAIVLLARTTSIQKAGTIFLVLTLLFSLYVLIFRAPGLYIEKRSLEIGFVMLGTVTFLALFFACFELFAFRSLKGERFVLLLSLFLVGDLLFFTKIYSYVGADSFTRSGILYPPLKTSHPLDTRNYRLNNPGYYLPYAHSTACSNSFMPYRVRSYGGVDSVVSAELPRYLQNFVDLNSSVAARFGVVSALQSTRLLELCGVRYNFLSPNEMVENPNALSRFSSFTDFRVEANLESTFQMLRDEAFDVSKTVILDSIPLYAPDQTPSPNSFTPLEFESTNTDRICLSIEQSSPRIILFNDTYNLGWHATWNQEPIPIYKAQGYFMAVSVPAGKGVLEFTFHPESFFFFLKISLGCGALFLLAVAYALFSRNPKRELLCAPSKS